MFSQLHPSKRDKAAKEIADYLHNHKKVDAIKAYRNASGLGLKESKVEIDKMYDAMYPEGSPSREFR